MDYIFQVKLILLLWNLWDFLKGKIDADKVMQGLHLEMFIENTDIGKEAI